MMKLKFEDVLDFVRAGDEDPHMEKMLQFHPDGPELLKQAKFICKMLERQADSVDDGDLVGGIAEDAGDMHDITAWESIAVMDEPSPMREYFQGMPRRTLASKSSSINQLVERASGSREELGTLVITVEGEQTTLSYDPSTAVMDRYGKPYLLKNLAAQKDIDGIQIRGRLITMFLPDSVQTDRPLTIRVSRNLKQMPARRLEFIFMPDRGPFVRGSTDRDGIVELPMPKRSGILRIDSKRPQLLHIELKK